jgi:hypothetical protein
MRLHRWLALLVCLWCLGATFAPVSASPLAQAALDPNAYFPSAEELPPGFAPGPEGIPDLQEERVHAALRQYLRLNPEVAADDGTLLQIQIHSAVDASAAQEVWEQILSTVTAQGANLTVASEQLGSDTMEGQLEVGFDGRGTVESAFVMFRQGNFVVIAEGIDYVGLPNLELAWTGARTVAAKLPA